MMQFKLSTYLHGHINTSYNQVLNKVKLKLSFMKIKTIACCIAAVFLSIQLIAQESKRSVPILKIYSNLEFSNFKSTNGNDTLITADERSSFFFGGFSPAVSILKENGNFQEFELSRLRFSNQEEEATINNVSSSTTERILGAKRTNFELGLRYEISWSLKKKVTTFMPAIGLSNKLHYMAMEFSPKTSNAFPMKSNIFRNSIAVVPRVQLKLSDRLFLDCNVTLPLVDYENSKEIIQNPSLPSNAQEQVTKEWFFLAQAFHLRIGLGFKL